MKKVAIISAYRSAIGSFGGTLQNIKLADLGASLIKQTLARHTLSPDIVDEVIMGNVLSAGQGQNIARQIAIKADIPVEKSAFTVNKVCGSGLKSVLLAAQSILLGDNDVVIAGGIELMSQAPYLSGESRFGQKFGHSTLVDSLLKDGLTDAFLDVPMGITAENIAEKYNLSRQDLDKFALESQEKAAAAITAGRFKDEILPIEIKTKRETLIFSQDEYPRTTSLEKLAQLRPAFKADGLVTAGNASGINDGAAIVLLMSEEKARALNLKPLAYIEGYATAGVTPSLMGLGPVPATQKLLQKVGKTVKDIDLFELNEAFASQSLAVIQDLDIDKAKVNVNGGAIALGHPIGASGTRILVTLIHELRKRQGQLGLASLCIGGGQGISLLISNNI